MNPETPLIFEEKKLRTAAYQKEYRLKNKEKIDAHRKEYHLKNKEKEAAYQKEYRLKNSKKIKANKLKNKEKIAEKQKGYNTKYVLTHKKEKNEYQKKYYLAHKNLEENEEERTKLQHGYTIFKDSEFFHFSDKDELVKLNPLARWSAIYRMYLDQDEDELKVAPVKYKLNEACEHKSNFLTPSL